MHRRHRRHHAAIAPRRFQSASHPPLLEDTNSTLVCIAIAHVNVYNILQFVCNVLYTLNTVLSLICADVPFWRALASMCYV